jgi:hypothetical protein
MQSYLYDGLLYYMVILKMEKKRNLDIEQDQIQYLSKAPKRRSGIRTIGLILLSLAFIVNIAMFVLISLDIM